MSISLLRQLLMKEAVKKSAGSSGIMTINKNIARDVDKLLQKYINDALAQGVDLDTLSPDQLKMIVAMNQPKPPRVFSGQEAMDQLNKLFPKKGEVIKGNFGKPFKEQIEAMKKSGDLVDEDNMVISEKITDREMFKDANKRFKGPIKEKQDMGEFGEINVETDYSSSINRPEFFDPKAKNMYGETVKTGAEFIQKEKERILNLINNKKKNMVPRTHSNYKLLKKSLQDQEDALEAIKITEDLGGNENMFDFLRTQNIADYKAKPLQRSNYTKTDAEIKAEIEANNRKGIESLKNKLDDPEDMATGGRAGFSEAGIVDPGLAEDKAFENAINSFKYYLKSGGKKNFRDYMRMSKGKYHEDQFRAEGGRAGYYTGGMIDVEPNLSDIGHGSDSLMARTRLISPGAQGTTSTGLNYLLAEDNDNIRVPFRVGKTAKKKKEKKKRPFSLLEMMMLPEMSFREPINFPYKSLEDIPPKVLEMLKKDPNFDLETFLTKVAWSDPDKTRIQTKLKGSDEAWGLYSPRSDTSFLNYQQFGKSEPIGDGLLSIKSPSDADKVQTILHEMRHGKMKEPWFMKSSAVPKWVREYEEKGLPHYLDSDIKDKYEKYRDTQKDVSGEELYVRFMDQHFGDVAESGTIAGSDYKPYFDKILKDEWDPYAERYKEILNEEKRVLDKPYGLAEGGRIGFSGGGMGRRAFLKLLATLGGGAAAFKTGILGLGEGTAKKAVSETVKKAAGSSEVPPYFFKLVDKIKTMGDETLASQDKAIAKKYKDYVMEEDFAGNITIIKKNMDDPYPEEVIMSYKVDEVSLPSGKGMAKVDEYEEFTVRPDMDGKMKDIEPGVPDEVVNEGSMFEDNMTEFGVNKKADGGRIDFMGGGLANVLARLGITGSSRRFLEKTFGKDVLEEMIKKDPDMHRGLLEVVEMFRNRDKEGLKMYMQKFLPHMDDEAIEEFIIGSTPDVQGLQGQLIRLGSGRDYAGKLEMMKKADEVKKLQEFDIKNVTKNAEGGRIGFSGGGIFRAIIAKAAAAKGMKPYEFIKVTSYKSLPPEVKMFMSADDFAKLKSGQEQLYNNYIDMMKTRKNFQQEVEAGKKTPASPIFEHMEKIMDQQSYVPKTVTSDDIAEAELMVKNRFQKGRKDNALGGLQTMLGE